MALPPIFIAFVGDYTGLKESANGVKKELAEVDAEGGASLESLGAVGKGVMLGMGVAMVGAGYESVKLAMNFQSAMTQVSTLAGVPKASLQGLGDGVLQLAGQVGFSPDSLAEALYHVESSFSSTGISGSQALNILKIAAEGAAVGHANLVDVQNALDAAIASGIPGVENYSQAMGALNAIVGAGDMSMQDLADAMGSGAVAVVKTYGLTLDDVGAALATLGDNNIRGAAAATDMRMAVQALSVPAKTAAQDLQTMGMTTSTLADDMKKGGLQLALNDLMKHMDKAGLAGLNMGNTLTTMFGKKAGVGLGVLMDQLDRFNSKYPKLESGAGGFGAAVAQNNDTVGQQINQIKASFESLGVTMGQKLLPVVTTILGDIAKGVSWLAQHQTVFYALASGIGALTTAFVLVKIATFAWSEALLLNPAVWIAMAIMGLGAAIYYAYEHSKTFRDIVNEVGRVLKEVLGKAVDYIKEHLPEIERVLKDVGRELEGAFKAAWREAGRLIQDFINGPVKYVRHGLDDFKTFWHAHGQEIKQDAEAIWHLISTLVVGQVKIMWQVIKGTLETIRDLWTFVWGLIRDTLKTVWDMIAGIIRVGVKTGLDIIGLFLDLLHGKWSKLGSDALKLITDAWNGINGIFSKFASDAGQLLVDAGRNIVKGLVNGIKDGFGLIKNIGKDLGDTVTGAFHSVMGIFSPSRRMYASGTMLTAGLVNALQDGKTPLATAAAKLGSAIMSGFGTPQLGLSVNGGMGTSFGTSLGTLGMGGAGVTQNVIQVTVQGSVRSDHDLRDVIQQEMLRLGGRNAVTYAPARI